VPSDKGVAFTVIASLLLITFFVLLIFLAIKPLRSNPLLFTIFALLVLVLALPLTSLLMVMGKVFCYERD